MFVDMFAKYQHTSVVEINESTTTPGSGGGGCGEPPPPANAISASSSKRYQIEKDLRKRFIKKG